MNLRTAFLCFLIAAPTTACGSSSTGINPAPIPADAGPGDSATNDAASEAQPDAADAAPASTRTMVYNPLFGDTHPQNLFLDPNFSVRQPGVGDWLVGSGAITGTGPTFFGGMMSDSPAGIALPVAHVSDESGSTLNYDLQMVAQVPGGPAPFRLRMWISTLDAAASTTLSGVTVGLLLSEYSQSVIEIKPDPQSARVIGGRTWHRFDGTITSDLKLGAFVILEFAASKNTWLVQAPEFIPAAIDPPSTTMALNPALTPSRRPATDAEKQLVDRYRHQPHLSVPASHAAVTDRPRGALRN